MIFYGKKKKGGRGWNDAFLVFQGQELIDDQFLASIGRPTDSGFAQPEVLANLCCRQAQVPNRPVGQNTAGTYPIVKGSSLLLTLGILGWLVCRLSWRIDTPLKHKTPPSFAEKMGALISSIAINLPRSGFKTPSNVPWLRYEPLQNAHILPCMLRFFIGLRLALEPNLKFWNNL